MSKVALNFLPADFINIYLDGGFYFILGRETHRRENGELRDPRIIINCRGSVSRREKTLCVSGGNLIGQRPRRFGRGSAANQGHPQRNLRLRSRGPISRARLCACTLATHFSQVQSIKYLVRIRRSCQRRSRKVVMSRAFSSLTLSFLFNLTDRDKTINNI